MKPSARRIERLLAKVTQRSSLPPYRDVLSFRSEAPTAPEGFVAFLRDDRRAAEMLIRIANHCNAREQEAIMPIDVTEGFKRDMLGAAETPGSGGAEPKGSAVAEEFR